MALFTLHESNNREDRESARGVCLGERRAYIGPRDAKIEDGRRLTTPHKSLFFVAWNHCIISEKTEEDRGYAQRDLVGEVTERDASFFRMQCGALIAVSSQLKSLSLVSKLQQTAKVYEPCKRLSWRFPPCHSCCCCCVHMRAASEFSLQNRLNEH